MFAKQAFPWALPHLPSGRECCVVMQGTQVKLCVFCTAPWVIGALPSSWWSCSPVADLPCGICCSNAEQLPLLPPEQTDFVLPEGEVIWWQLSWGLLWQSLDTVATPHCGAAWIWAPGPSSAVWAEAQEVELKLPNYLLWKELCNFHKGQLRTKILPYCGSLLCKTFCCFCKVFIYISSAFPDIR